MPFYCSPSIHLLLLLWLGPIRTYNYLNCSSIDAYRSRPNILVAKHHWVGWLYLAFEVVALAVYLVDLRLYSRFRVRRSAAGQTQTSEPDLPDTDRWNTLRFVVW